jgi:hypothetical protein
MDMAKVINNRKMREQREAEREYITRHARWMAQRRADARARGYRGPLTREEASRRALRALQD